MSPQNTQTDKQETDYGILDRYAKLLDSSIKVPGTNKSFGIDPIIGLIPGVGSVLGYGFSAVLVFQVVKLGASKRVMLKMLINAGLDATIGAIPVLGTIFDLTYKANERNLRLFKEHHDEGKHTESAMPLFLIVMLVSIGMIAVLSYVVVKAMIWLCHNIF